MPDAADEACIHLIGTLQLNEPLHRVEWACLDCGRVFAWVAVEVAALNFGALAAWRNQVGITDLHWRRFERRMQEEGRVA